MVRHATGRDEVRRPERNATEEVVPNIICSCSAYSRLAAQPMSDHTPSQIWHVICTLLQLANITEVTGSHKQFDLPKEIWLMCLTPEVHSTLVETDTCDTSKLVEEAEKQHNAYLAATHLRPSTLSISDITAVRQSPTRPVARWTLTSSKRLRVRSSLRVKI